MLWDHNCNVLDDKGIIVDDALIKDVNARSTETTLSGPDRQADWNLTVRTAIPTVAELICSHIGNLPYVIKPPPEYNFLGCPSLMSTRKGCNMDVYEKYLEEPFGAYEYSCLWDATWNWSYRRYRSIGQQDDVDPFTACSWTWLKWAGAVSMHD